MRIGGPYPLALGLGYKNAIFEARKKGTRR